MLLLYDRKMGNLLRQLRVRVNQHFVGVSVKSPGDCFKVVQGDAGSGIQNPADGGLRDPRYFCHFGLGVQVWPGVHPFPQALRQLRSEVWLVHVSDCNQKMVAVNN